MYGDGRFGCTDNYTDQALISQNKLTELYYAAYPVRTMQSDLEYYARQVERSGLAEIYKTTMKTK